MGKLLNIIENPKVIGQYVKGVSEARRSEENVYHLAFDRENDGGWYIDLPEWEGAHARLAMVAGADSLLEFVGGGSSRVWVEVVKTQTQIEDLDSDKSFFRCDVMEKSTFGGATYQVHLTDFDRTMWLCPVTLFVLGEYPNCLYIRNEA